MPNIKNHQQETALDIALNNHYLCCAFKILEDKRFNSINLLSFKQLLEITLRNKKYGKYSKITNLQIIVNNLEKKELDSDLMRVVSFLRENMDTIKSEIMKGKITLIDRILS